MPAPNVTGAGTRNGQGVGANTPTHPAHQADDILLVMYENPNNAIAVTTANGFAQIAPPAPQGTGVANSVTATQLDLRWKRAANSAETQMTYTGDADHSITGVIGIRGCIKAGNPWNAQAGAVQAVSQTGVSVPGLTTLSDQSLVVFIIANMFSATIEQILSFVAPSDLDSFAQISTPNVWQTGSGNGGGLSVFAGIKAVAGPVNPLVATLKNNSVQGLATLAFTPAVLGSLGSDVVGVADLVSIGFID